MSKVAQEVERSNASRKNKIAVHDRNCIPLIPPGKPYECMDDEELRAVVCKHNLPVTLLPPTYIGEAASIRWHMMCSLPEQE
ncbi:MAG: hypothetical protein AAB515_01425 [Patescibacteria group bacterium]